MSVNSFDANFYSAANPDLAAAGLTTPEQLFSHFQNFGLNEGRKFSAFVDLNFYKENNLDLVAAGLTTNRQVYDHLQNFGVAERRRFSPWANLDFYLATNTDVRQAFGENREAAFDHLQRFGINEARQFSPLINLNYYLVANPDVAQAFGGERFKTLQHLENFGIFEERKFSLNFDPTYYRKIHPDLAAANLNNLQLLQHFETYGVNEGRRSAENFDIRYYLENNADLKAAGLNYQQALQHAYLYGWREGRASSPGHTLDEPAVIWKQSITRVPNAAFLYSIFDLSLDSSGNVRAVDGTHLPSNTPTPSQGALSIYDRSNGALVSKQNINGGIPPYPKAVAYDSAGNIFVTGTSVDRILLGPRVGLIDKYDSNGNVLWSRGLINNYSIYNVTTSNDIAADGAGNVYIAGQTNENLDGSNAGGSDALIIKYNSNGDRQWTKQFGTSQQDSAFTVTADSAGSVYVMGSSGTDDWLAKYDSLTGDRIWIKQLDQATYDDVYSRDLVVDNSGNLYVAVSSEVNLGGTNVGNVNTSLAKYDGLTGNQQWLQQVGTAYTALTDLDLDDAGNVYVTWNGRSYKFTSSGIRESFLPILKTDDISSTNEFYKISLDSSGNIYTLDYDSYESLISKYSPISNFL